MERDRHWSDRDWCSACVLVELPTGFSVALVPLWFCWFGSVMDEILESLSPKDRERESHPCVNLHREKLPQLDAVTVRIDEGKMSVLVAKG